MTYNGQVSIPPSQFNLAAVAQPFVWQRGIPSPGAPGVGVPAVGGVPGCANLLAVNPPSLFESYEIYSIVIGWTAQLIFPGALPPDVSVDAEAALLVNDSVVYANTVTQQATFGSASALADGTWTADLVNPIVIGARDKLSLRTGVRPSQPVSGNSIYVGLQALYASPVVIVPAPFESSINYRVLNREESR